jgi:AcrR family transcriptional regulator
VRTGVENARYYVRVPVPKGATIDPAATRSRIVAVLEPVIYERGIDGVGVAELCALAGISKETLYRHFGSKDGLVAAILDQRSDRVISWIRNAHDRAGSDPKARLAAVMAALGRWYPEPEFRGCAIVNAATQHREPEVLTVSDRHLRRYLDILREIARDAGASDPEQLARQWLQLIEGATVVASVSRVGARRVAKDLRDAALALLAAATGP